MSEQLPRTLFGRTIKKNFIILSLALLVTEIGWKCLKYINRRIVDTKRNRENKDLFEVLMFTHTGTYCRDHAARKIPCDKSTCPVEKVRRLEWYLRSAKNTLDVCMYMMTCKNITEAILSARRKGAIVRIIADEGMAQNPSYNQQILFFRRAGIETRTNKSKFESFMHHKFAVIDGELVLFGSTNWTMLAFYGNNDAIVVTNNNECLRAYTNEFEKLWLDFGS